MKVSAECSCGGTLVDDGPQALWAFIEAHTTPRVEPVPGVRHEVELHDTHVEIEGMKLW